MGVRRPVSFLENLMDALFPYTEALVGIAQVSIVFAGFDGISVVLSRHLREQWTYGEAVRMACMIESSLTAAFLRAYFYCCGMTATYYAQ